MEYVMDGGEMLSFEEAKDEIVRLIEELAAVNTRQHDRQNADFWHAKASEVRALHETDVAAFAGACCKMAVPVDIYDSGHLVCQFTLHNGSWKCCYPEN